VCPHCGATLQAKVAPSRDEAKKGKHPDGVHAGFVSKKPDPKGPSGTSANPSGVSSPGGGSKASFSGTGFGIFADGAVASFLAQHRERFATCKVSQLTRNVAEFGMGVANVLDAGGVTDATVQKTLREAVKKMRAVKLLQGVVERPKARREVVSHLEHAMKACRERGV
jgi:hypothetical protein